MAISRWLGTVSSVVLSMVFALQGAAAQNAAKIGIASAVKNRVDGSVGGGTRPLSAGSSVFAREVVRTGQESMAQLLFLDETSLSIGPQSEVTLDRFVFDPNRGTGNVVINATRGAFRFATGSQRPGNYQIRTPVATIGVRGTLFDIYLAVNRLGELVLVLILISGETTSTFNGQTYVLNVPGQALIIQNGKAEVVTWDSTLFSVVSQVPFPAYGSQWQAAPWFTQLPGPVQDNVEQIIGTGPGFTPPDGGDGGGDFN